MILLPGRIIDKIAFCPITGCWFWLGWDSGNGYGKVWWEGRGEMAHRIVYRLLVGYIPEGHVLDHLCRMRLCCNPHHLEPVTVAENTQRGTAVLFPKALN
jgi:hypothetical protein